MRKNDLVELKKMDIAALSERVKKVQSEVAQMTIDKNMQKMTNLKQLKSKRKDLAQILTVKRQKELLVQLEEKNG